MCGDITEYDLERLHPAYAVDGFGGPIWSMAANNDGTQLAVSSRDGAHNGRGAATPRS